MLKQDTGFSSAPLAERSGIVPVAVARDQRLTMVRWEKGNDVSAD